MTTSKEFKLDLPYRMFPSETDQYGIVFDVNSHGFRTSEFNTVDHTHTKFIVFGDSHTWGEGNQQCDTWPELLKEKINISQMFNLGQRGCSSDYMVRIMPACLEYFKPDYVFVLWADSSRFENEKDGVFTQTLVSNPNKEWQRIIKIKGIDWPEENYKAKTAIARNLCNSLSIPLIELTLQDLIPHFALWKEFGRVDIAFSIDNIGQRFEYERFGADWERANTIVDVVHAHRQVMPNITTQLCFTINIQNIYYLDELLAWADTKNFTSIYFNMMHSPEYMNIQNLTPTAQELVLDKLKTTFWKNTKYQQEIDNVIRFIELGSGSDGKEFLRKMKQTDGYRNQCFTDTHSEIARAMGYE